MNIDADLAEARPAVLLAAILHLLTCSAAHGMTAAKCKALVLHLGALADRSDTDPLLSRVCEELAEVWLRLEHGLVQGCQQEVERRRADAQLPVVLH
jgi:hypothetical protein